jgi:protein-tyrosine phosphatase
VIDILFLCTANICRSPMAEAMFRHVVEERGGDFRVGSAGFLQEGLPASDQAIEVLARRGIDLSDHRSRVTTPALLGEADLVVAMARRHVREASLVDPTAFPRTFTLKELVRRASEEGSVTGAASVADWCDAMGEGRTQVQLLGDSSKDDIADPVGRPVRVFKKTAAELDELLDGLWEALRGL